MKRTIPGCIHEIYNRLNADGEFYWRDCYYKTTTKPVEVMYTSLAHSTLSKELGYFTAETLTDLRKQLKEFYYEGYIVDAIIEVEKPEFNNIWE